MTCFALGFCLFSLLSISFAANAPGVNHTPDESQAVRATVADYIESYYTGDAARMERSLHPHYLKHVIKESDGSLKMTEKTGLQMVQDVRSHGPSDLPKSEQTEQITVLDDTFHTYTYDPEGRIVQVDTSPAGDRYVYDALGHRVGQYNSSGANEYVFSYNLAAVPENSSGIICDWGCGTGNTLQSVNVYAGARHLAYYWNGTTTFLAKDWIGTVRARTNLAGSTTPVETCTSMPFGDSLSCSSTDGMPGYVDRDHFAGMESYDWTDDLGYTPARAYSSRQGRWIRPDPAGLAAMDLTSPQTWNRYAYVTNNPVSMTDPLGLDSETSSTDSSGNITDYTTVDVTADLDISNFAPVFTSLTPNNIGGFDVPGETVNVTDTLPTGPQTLTLSPQGQDCLAKVQSAVNSALNTSTAFLGPQMGGHQDDPSDPGLINGAYNFNFRAPGMQFGDPGAHAVPGQNWNCGRYRGSGLHIPVPGGGCNPLGDPTFSPWGFNAQQNASYFTAHIDSSNPFDDWLVFSIT